MVIVTKMLRKIPMISKLNADYYYAKKKASHLRAEIRTEPLSSLVLALNVRLFPGNKPRCGELGYSILSSILSSGLPSAR